MKERPIIFSAPMARAILAGRKTMTRRLVKQQPYRQELRPAGQHTGTGEEHWCIDGQAYSRSWAWPVGTPPCVPEELCPHGKPGDQLWVRTEHWKFVPPETNTGNLQIWDEATRICRWRDREIANVKPSLEPRFKDGWGWKRTVAMFMPRWASRIALEITEVRVERLHDISEADARAEGIDGNDALVGQISNPFVTAFADLWESIRGAGSWAANPWVWAIAFRPVNPARDGAEVRRG